MNKIVEALKGTGVFYIATVEGDQPHVRPFSSVCEFEDKAYICTNNTKKCYSQMITNSKVEISGMAKDGSWIRLTAKLVRDNRDEARAAMLADPTGPSNLYKVGDGIFEVFYLDDVSCTKYSFKADPETIA